VRRGSGYQPSMRWCVRGLRAKLQDIMRLMMSFGEPWLQRTSWHRMSRQVSHVATVIFDGLTLILFQSKAVKRSFGTSLWQPHWPSHTWTQLLSEPSKQPTVNCLNTLNLLLITAFSQWLWFFGSFDSSTSSYSSDLGNKIRASSGEDKETSFLFQHIPVLIQRFNSVLLHDSFRLSPRTVRTNSLPDLILTSCF